jgi:hypothetical protein
MFIVLDNISATYTNLIKIPVSHVVAEQMAFAKGSIIEINGWESLRPYNFRHHDKLVFVRVTV